MRAWLNTTTHRVYLVAVVLILAVIFVVFFLLLQPKPAAAPLNQAPQVLSETTPARQEPSPVVNETTPELTKPLDLDGIEAKSFLVYDSASGAKLTGQNETFALPIASVTKLMTAYVAYEQLNLSQEIITIMPEDIVDVSPVLGLKVGDRVKAIDLFDAMLIGSANDAAQTLGNYVGRELNLPFKDLMNQQAVALGMSDSHFSNPVGFDSETNYSTAADLQLLVTAAHQYQAFSLVGRERSYSFTSAGGNKYSVKATNKLLASDPEISAIKTGFTDEAQGAMITEINHNNHKFIIIVLGSSDREGDTLRLKKAIIGSYKWVK